STPAGTSPTRGAAWVASAPSGGRGTRGLRRRPWSPAPGRRIRRTCTAYPDCWPPLASSRGTIGCPQHETGPPGAVTTMISVPHARHLRRWPTAGPASAISARAGRGRLAEPRAPELRVGVELGDDVLAEQADRLLGRVPRHVEREAEHQLVAPHAVVALHLLEHLVGVAAA